MKKNKKVYGYLTWILIGIVFSCVVCAVKLSGSFSVTKLYDSGDVYEIFDSVYRTADKQPDGYQESSGKVVLNQGSFEYSIEIVKNQNKWKYFCLSLEDVVSEDIEGEISFVNKKKDSKKEKLVWKLEEGMNLIPVAQNKFDVIDIEITGEPGSSFYVKDMQLRENKPIFLWKNAIGFTTAAFLTYILISGGIIWIWRKAKIKTNFYCWVEVLQELFISIGRCLRIPVSLISEGKVRSRLRTFLFLLMFLYNFYVHIANIYYERFKYILVVYGILIFLISIISINSDMTKKNWNNPLVWSWLVLWVMACVSDFILPKEFRFVGYLMVFLLGFFIFVWNNMKHPKEMIRDFVKAVHLFFVFVLLVCLVFRPDNGVVRYAGFSNNPSIFALYLGTVWGVVLGGLEDAIRSKEKRKHIVMYVLEGCAVFCFMWKSQSAGPLICVALMSFLWLARMYCYARREKMGKRLAFVVITALLLILPVFGIMNYGLKHVPRALGTTVRYENEVAIQKKTFGMVAQASGIKEKLSETRLGQKFSSSSISSILAYRDYYYRGYLRDMNLFGHSKRPVLWGRTRLPHNSVLAMAHRYGIFTVVPFIIMLLTVFIRTWRYSGKDVKGSAMPLYICMFFMIVSMSDNVEQPFVWLPWIGFYLLMGSVFAEDEFLADEKAS